MTLLPNQIPDAILFDLDNTLCTFIDGKKAACNAVSEYVNAGSGQGLFEYFLRPLYDFEDPRHIYDYLHDTGTYSEQEIDHITCLYEEVKIHHINPYPGVTETISRLYESGVRMAIVTDASAIQAEKRIHKCGFSRYFPVIITPDRSGARKPDYASFILALEELGTRAGNVWVVGDSLRREIVPGNELGYTTVHARYGDWIGGDIAPPGPVHTIDRFSDLLRLPGLIPAPLC